ncbi:hypothetical protein [Bdellovibrio sp. HCB337]|uniref:hypothetical protein n=1 Tax=Bdellovibrio sp. HCB337 TaxID=3394358 RepID=UPI0039A74449
MKYAFALLTFCATSIAMAAPRVNSGGGGWACRKNDSTGQVMWIKAADLTKVEFYTPGAGLKELSGDRWTLLKEQHARIEKVVPILASLMRLHPFDIANNLVAIPDALNFVPDAELRYKPPASSCVGGLVSYVQLADTTMDGKVIYSSRVWNMPEFSEFHKAAILLHEEIYFALRESLGDESSYRTRQLMGLLYSNMDENTLRQAVDYVLQSKPRPRPGIFGFENVPALFNVDLQCNISFNNGPVSFAWKPQTPGEAMTVSLEGLQFRVKTSVTDSSPLQLEILDEKTNVSALLDEAQTVATFNALRRTSVILKLGSELTAQLYCDSNSPLEKDPL